MNKSAYISKNKESNEKETRLNLERTAPASWAPYPSKQGNTSLKH
jgi:hypothetical protein